MYIVRILESICIHIGRSALFLSHNVIRISHICRKQNSSIQTFQQDSLYTHIYKFIFILHVYHICLRRKLLKIIFFRIMHLSYYHNKSKSSSK